MRTLVDLGETQLRELDELSRETKRSRASLIREAVADFLARRRKSRECEAFGLWGDRKTDGLAYQEQLRGEW